MYVCMCVGHGCIYVCGVGRRMNLCVRVFMCGVCICVGGMSVCMCEGECMCGEWVGEYIHIGMGCMCVYMCTCAGVCVWGVGWYIYVCVCVSIFRCMCVGDDCMCGWVGVCVSVYI